MLIDTTLAIAVLLGVIACAWDLSTARIPNVLTFGATVIALPVLYVHGGMPAIGLGLAGALVGLALFFPYFALGGLGAGDVKLLAALGMWMGPGMTLWTAIFASIAGGAMALVVALSRGYLRQALANLRLLLTHWRVAGVRPLDELTLDNNRSVRLPYALPILTGVLMTIWLR